MAIYINHEAIITKGLLKGMKGLVVGTWYNEVTIRIDEYTQVIVNIDCIEQN